MVDVLIRGVAEEDLASLKEIAAEEGSSLQALLAELLRDHAAYVRRQKTLAAIIARNEGQPPFEMSEAEREEVFDAMSDDIEAKWDRLWADRDR